MKKTQETVVLGLAINDFFHTQFFELTFKSKCSFLFTVTFCCSITRQKSMIPLKYRYCEDRHSLMKEVVLLKKNKKTPSNTTPKHTIYLLSVWRYGIVPEVWIYPELVICLPQISAQFKGVYHHITVNIYPMFSKTYCFIIVIMFLLEI